LRVVLLRQAQRLLQRQALGSSRQRRQQTTRPYGISHHICLDCNPLAVANSLGK
jgi:ribosomal protein L32